MAHYAYLDENNIVVNVIVGKDETDTTQNWEEYYAQGTPYTVKRTSYNGNIRKNYAAIDGKYDPELDAFIPIKCHNQATLNRDTCLWECPNPDHDVPTE
jgi:hypothetical protein